MSWQHSEFGWVNTSSKFNQFKFNILWAGVVYGHPQKSGTWKSSKKPWDVSCAHSWGPPAHSETTPVQGRPGIFRENIGDTNWNFGYVTWMGCNPVIKQVVDSLSHVLQGFIHPRWCRIPEPSTVGHDLSSLKLTAKALENGWLENYLPFGAKGLFSGTSC